MIDDNLYFYKAKVISVYDGDTCRVNIDLGLNTWIFNEKVRLSEIDTPEIRGSTREQGLISRDYLRGLILDKEVLIQTVKDRKGRYGRYLAKIWIKQDEKYTCVNDLMIKNNYAVKYG